MKLALLMLVASFVLYFSSADAEELDRTVWRMVEVDGGWVDYEVRYTVQVPALAQD